MSNASFMIPRARLEEVYAHCLSRKPNEACGLLLGKDDRVLDVRPTRNAMESPIRYALDPLEQLRVLRDAEAQGMALVGIYHSHVQTEAYPSATDVEAADEAEWDVNYLIVSLARPRPMARVFRIAEGNITERDLYVID